MNKVREILNHVLELTTSPAEFIVFIMKYMSEDERLEVFSHFCKECGSENPACQCWNDE